MNRPPVDDRSPVQDVGRVLYWIYAGRMTVALAVYGAALLVGDGWLAGGAWLPGMSVRTVSFITLAAVALVTGLSYSYSHVRHVGPPCFVRTGLARPRCTEGSHFCGIPVWRDFPATARSI